MCFLNLGQSSRFRQNVQNTSQVLADSRRFSQVLAGSRRFSQVLAGSRRFLQVFAGSRRCNKPLKNVKSHQNRALICMFSGRKWNSGTAWRFSQFSCLLLRPFKSHFLQAAPGLFFCSAFPSGKTSLRHFSKTRSFSRVSTVLALLLLI